MNTLKRERIIKNLYDLQCLDSWEDSEHFMEAVEGVRIHFGIKWIDLNDVEFELIERYKSEMPGASRSCVLDNVAEDDQYKLIDKFDTTEELFADETCSAMTFEKFRALCLEYMDFSHLI